MNKFKKNNNWYDYPQEIKHWNKDIDYIMFIDENGNGGKITNTLKKIINNDEIINHNKFLADLTETLNNTNCKIISVTIDLVKCLKNGYIQNVYETAFDLLLERYIYITRYEKKGIIILEARGKKEDKQLLNHIYNIIYNRDKNKITTNELKSKIQGIYFNPKWNEKYISTYVGLEITDLFSYPIHQYIKYNKENPSFEILKKKIDGYPKFINKGIIIFPK